MGEDKKSIIKQNEHTCVPLTNEEVKVKLATQDLKDKLRAKLVPKDDPNVLNLEHLTGEQILTTDGLQFLQYDNQVLNNRILIFFSERALRMISTCSFWYGDGTFKAGKF